MTKIRFFLFIKNAIFYSEARRGGGETEARRRRRPRGRAGGRRRKKRHGKVTPGILLYWIIIIWDYYYKDYSTIHSYVGSQKDAAMYGFIQGQAAYIIKTQV